MSRRRVFIVGVVVAALVTLWIWLHPIDVTYRLWRLRSDPDPVVYQPELCAKGPSVLPHIYEAFDEYGDRDDVEGFRVAVAATLRCIRSQQAPIVIEQSLYFDAPADPQLFATIVKAFDQEPDVERRGAMLTFMWELDFRARFAIWAGIASGPRTIPYPWDQVPSIDPYGKRKGFDRETIRTEWCRVVAPVVWKRLATWSYSEHQKGDALRELAAADCNTADRVRLLELSSERGVYLGFVLAVGDSPERARELLVPLYAASVPCDRQVDAFNGMLRALDAAVVSIVADAQGPCIREDECRDVADCRAHLIDRLIVRL